MRAFFEPAIQLMNRLKYPQKFLLVGLLMLLPLGLAGSQYTVQINKDINFAAKEQLGLKLHGPLMAFLSAVQEHEALSLAYAKGDKSVEASLRTVWGRMELAVQRVDAADEQLSHDLQVSEQWDSVRQAWLALKDKALQMSADETIQAHTVLIDNTLLLIAAVGNNSNMILDPNIDTYYLMDQVITQLPQLTTTLSQVRAYGRVLLQSSTTVSGSSASIDYRIRLLTLSSSLRAMLSGKLQSMGYVFNTNPDLRTRLSAVLDPIHFR